MLTFQLLYLGILLMIINSLENRLVKNKVDATAAEVVDRRRAATEEKSAEQASVCPLS